MERAVVGTGFIGGILGRALAGAGHEVALAVKPGHGRRLALRLIDH